MNIPTINQLETLNTNSLDSNITKLPDPEIIKEINNLKDYFNFKLSDWVNELEKDDKIIAIIEDIIANLIKSETKVIEFDKEELRQIIDAIQDELSAINNDHRATRVEIANLLGLTSKNKLNMLIYKGKKSKLSLTEKTLLNSIVKILNSDQFTKLIEADIDENQKQEILGIIIKIRALKKYILDENKTPSNEENKEKTDYEKIEEKVAELQNKKSPKAIKIPYSGEEFKDDFNEIIFDLKNSSIIHDGPQLAGAPRKTAYMCGINAVNSIYVYFRNKQKYMYEYIKKATEIMKEAAKNKEFEGMKASQIRKIIITRTYHSLTTEIPDTSEEQEIYAPAETNNTSEEQEITTPAEINNTTHPTPTINYRDEEIDNYIDSFIKERHIKNTDLEENPELAHWINLFLITGLPTESKQEILESFADELRTTDINNYKDLIELFTNSSEINKYKNLSLNQASRIFYLVMVYELYVKNNDYNKAMRKITTLLPQLPETYSGTNNMPKFFGNYPSIK